MSQGGYLAGTQTVTQTQPDTVPQPPPQRHPEQRPPPREELIECGGDKGRRGRPVRARLRAVLDIVLFAQWSLVLVSGVVLWTAPGGPRSGRRELLFGLAKREWADLHTWFSLAAVTITVAHVALNWRLLRSALRCLRG